MKTTFTTFSCRTKTSILTHWAFKKRTSWYDTLPVSDIDGLYEGEDVSATQQIVNIGGGDGYTAQKGILKQWKSGLSDDNPCSLIEDQGVRFKPTLLVGVYPQESAELTPASSDGAANRIKFNVETEVVCSFRGLRKAKVVAA